MFAKLCMWFSYFFKKHCVLFNLVVNLLLNSKKTILFVFFFFCTGCAITMEISMVACAVLAAGWLGGWLRGTPGRAEKRERKRKNSIPREIKDRRKKNKIFPEEKVRSHAGGEEKQKKQYPPTKWQQRVDFWNYQFVLENGFKNFRPFETSSSGSPWAGGDAQICRREEKAGGRRWTSWSRSAARRHQGKKVSPGGKINLG